MRGSCPGLPEPANNSSSGAGITWPTGPTTSRRLASPASSIPQGVSWPQSRHDTFRWAPPASPASRAARFCSRRPRERSSRPGSMRAREASSSASRCTSTGKFEGSRRKAAWCSIRAWPRGRLPGGSWSPRFTRWSSEAVARPLLPPASGGSSSTRTGEAWSPPAGSPLRIPAASGGNGFPRSPPTRKAGSCSPTWPEMTRIWTGQSMSRNCVLSTARAAPGLSPPGRSSWPTRNARQHPFGPLTATV